MSHKLAPWNGVPKLKPDRVCELTLPHLPTIDGPADSFTLLGNGRSYGDVCLNDQGTVLKTRGLDRFIEFEPKTGKIRCQSGITLGEILDFVVPQGWFLPVTPGTQFATVGGAIANDVHGKNHHVEGTFGHHVLSLELVRSDGQRLRCSDSENTEWFNATVGGLGLTGLIAWVELQLKSIQSPWIWMRSHRFQNLGEFWQLNRSLEKEWPYVVAWVDCVSRSRGAGRGVIYAGEHANSQTQRHFYKEIQRTIPVQPPQSLVNSLSLRVFNKLYYRKRVYPQGRFSHWLPFFYPLDGLKNWNRIYGRAGFYQYQCVLPPETSEDATAELLHVIGQSRQGSFLAVLKTFGSKSSKGMLSFPRPGTTFALDFPNHGQRTLRLLAKLDEVVSEAGGALYPAKDARMPAAMFREGYPEWERFTDFIDPQFTSHFWKRVTQ